MKHFLNLERCTCGAYRYLAVREHKKSYEVYLIHHMHSTDADARKYTKLASIPKYRLNIHEERLNEEKQTKTIQINFEQTLALKSLLKELCNTTAFSGYLAAGDDDQKSLEEIELLTP